MYAEQAQTARSTGQISGSSRLGHQTDSAVRQSEITEELARLARAVELLGMTVSQISDRLVPVRRQTANQTSEKEPTPPEPVLCGVADAIRAQRKHIEASQNVLSRALSELEV